MAASPLCPACGEVDSVAHHVLGCGDGPSAWRAIRRVYRTWDAFGGGAATDPQMLSLRVRLLPSFVSLGYSLPKA
jgi:hypothetical protein